VADAKATKKISAKGIMADLKAGMSDSELIKKYDISFQALQDLFEKLVNANLATKAYFDKRAVSQIGARKAEETAQTCPYCGFSTSEQFRECPSCRQDVSEWLDTMELTKMLGSTFD
jgi:lipopolysaccharide biosynthesis regulator YciM